MELIGSLLFVLTLALLVIVFISRPFLQRGKARTFQEASAEEKQEHERSALLAERDRILIALQDLDFDHALGKIPPEDYPQQRAALMKTGADVLRQLDTLDPQHAGAASEVDRIEAAVAARRADAVQGISTRPATAGGNGTAVKDELEGMIAARKRERKESSAGFCPRCGRPVSKSDKFCSKCGATL